MSRDRRPRSSFCAAGDDRAPKRPNNNRRRLMFADERNVIDLATDVGSEEEEAHPVASASTGAAAAAAAAARSSGVSLSSATASATASSGSVAPSAPPSSSCTSAPTSGALLTSDVTAIRHILTDLNRLHQWLQDDHPLSLAPYARLLEDTLSSLSANNQLCSNMVGFLARSGTGKSFLINLLLFLTSHSEREYGSEKFRAEQKLEYEQLLSAVKPERVSVRRLADEWNEQLSGELEQASRATRAAFVDKLRSAYPESRESTVFKGSNHSWLLPSKAGVTRTTTLVSRIRYGRTFQMAVVYHSEQELRDMAFEALEILQAGGEPSPAVLARYRALRHPNMPEQPQENVQSIPQAQHWHLHPKAQEHAGRVHVLIGRGAVAMKAISTISSFEYDRAWVARAMQQINNTPALAFAVATVDVLVPSRLLANGVQLRDITGFGDPDFEELARREILLCDLVLVLETQAFTSNTESGNSVRDSQLLQNMLRSEHTQKQVHFINYMEGKSGHTLWAHPEEQQERAAEVDKFTEEMNKWLRSNIVLPMARAIPAATEASATAVDEARLLARLHRCTRFYSIEPVAFASVALHLVDVVAGNHASVSAGSELRSMSQRSGVLELLSSVASLAQTKAIRAMQAVLGQGQANFDSVECVATAASSAESDAPAMDVEMSSSSAASSSAAPSSTPATSNALFLTLMEVVDAAVRVPVTSLDIDALSDLTSQLSTRKLANCLETAAKAVHMDTERSNWNSQFRTITNALKWKELLQIDAARAALAATVARDPDSFAQLSLANRLSSLHPKYKGMKRPLFLRRMAFSYYVDHPLDWSAMQAELRHGSTAWLRPRVQELTQQLLHALIPQQLRTSPPILAAQKRALRLLDTALNAGLDTLFSGILSMARLPGEFDLHAFVPTVVNYLHDHWSQWQSMTDNTQLRQSVRDSCPELLDDLSDYFTKQLTKLLDTRGKTLFWNLFHYQSSRSVVRVTVNSFVAELLKELEALRGGGTALSHGQARQAELADMKVFLQSWAVDAQVTLKTAQASTDALVKQLQSDVLEMILQRQLLTVGMEAHLKILPDLLAARDSLINFRLAPLKASHIPVALGCKAQATKIGRQEASQLVAQLMRDMMDPNNKAPAQLSAQATCLAARLGTGAANGGRWEQLRHVLARWALEIANVPGDGDCLFTAVAHQLRWATQHDKLAHVSGIRIRAAAPLPGSSAAPAAVSSVASSTITPQQLRELAADYVYRVHKDAPELFKQATDTALSAYCQNMRQSGVWAGDDEIQALANILDVQIALWMDGHVRPRLIQPLARQVAGINEPSALPTIHIGLVSAQSNGPLNHFVSVVPMLPQARAQVRLDPRLHWVGTHATPRTPPPAAIQPLAAPLLHQHQLPPASAVPKKSALKQQTHK